MQVAFSEELLPLLMGLILSLKKERFTSVISQQMNNFFDRHWILTRENQITDEVVLNKHVVRCLLNAIHFVRLQVDSTPK